MLDFNNKFPRQIIHPISYLNLFNFLSFKKTKKIKKNISRIFSLNNKDLIFIGRARTAIYLILKYFLKNNKKDKVIIAPFTIPAIINLIKKAGAKPLFVDFEKNTTSLNLNDLKKKIRKYKPLALIITHYHINEHNYKDICKYCKKFDVKVIEDCAISYFGKSRNTRINSLSDASFFSFSSFKALNYFYGGAIYTKNKKLYEFLINHTKKWKSLTLFDYLLQALQTKLYQVLTFQLVFNLFTFFFLKNKNKDKIKKNYFSSEKIKNDYFKIPSNGFYWEMENKILSLKKIIRHRQEISQIYFKHLKDLSVLPSKFSKKDIFNNSFNFYLIQSENSYEIRKKLFEKGLDTGKLFYENCGKISKKKNSKKLNNIDDLINKIIILPTHLRINKTYAEFLSKNILAIYQNFKNENKKNF